ncbi:MAG: histidine kinase [Chitinophagaceae bacterium]
MEKLNDKWFRIIGIPSVAMLANLLFYHNGFRNSTVAFWDNFMVEFMIVGLNWEINRLYIIYSRRRYPYREDIKKRIITGIIGHFLITSALMCSLVYILDITHFYGSSVHFTFPSSYLYNIYMGNLFAILIIGIYEGIYYFRKWHVTSVEAEALKKENLQSQLDSLKREINPHFLFNNLSSLSSLIMEDQLQAVKFVKELSSVYRYLLQANDSDLTTLDRELNFIDNYFHLLKTRFGEGIILETNISEQYSQFMLPPLTLQVLVENAVKHNSILPEKPLRINLYTDEANNLIVINNLQRRHSAVLSNKLGLRNVITKYRLLNHRNVMIKQTDSVFQVIIPLIKPDRYENTHS